MDRILILDFGSQVTQLIARRVREAGVYCEIQPYNRTDQQVRDFKPKGIILSGGPCSVLDKDSPRAPQAVFKLGVPLLGICYGQQTMCVQLGGAVEGGHAREFGKALMEVKEDCDLYRNFWSPGVRPQVWMSHGDRVSKLPEGFRTTAVSDGAPFAFIADVKRHYYGTMFHPEVVHTLDGAKLLANFVHKICGCGSDWNMRAFREAEIEENSETGRQGQGDLWIIRRRG